MAFDCTLRSMPSRAVRPVRARRRLRSLAALAALVIVAGVAAACGGGSAGAGASSSAPGVTSNEITLGTSLSLTGAIAAECAPVADAMDAVFQATNAAGGVNGRKINDIVMDDGSVATNVASKGRSLLRNPVFAFTGACTSTEANTLYPMLDAASVPWLFPFTSVPALLSPVKKGIFSIDPLYNTQIKSVVSAAMKKYGPGSLYFATAQVPDYQAQLDTAKQAAIAAGGSWAGGESVVPGQADLSPILLHIRASHPAYVMLNSEASDSLRIVNQLVQQGGLPSKNVIGVVNLLLDAFVDQVDPSAATKVTAVSPVAPEDSAEAASCVKALAKYHSKDKPGLSAMEGCAVAEATVAALKLPGRNLTRERLVSALNSAHNVSLSPLVEPVSFSPANHMGVNKMFLENLTGQRRRVVVGTVNGG